jgi:prepilin-type N-terminal cleavage/methylation domain-containing protein
MRSHAKSKRSVCRKHLRGYTLFELLLVLAILAVIALLTLPNVGRVYESYRLKQVTAKVKTNLAAARIHAIDTGVPYVFRFEPGGTNYVINDATSNTESSSVGDSAESAAWNYAGKLPTGFRFEASRTGVARPVRLGAEHFAGLEHANDLALIAWSEPFWFYPDGTAEDQRLEIADAQQSMRIVVRGLTGDVSFERSAAKSKQ